MKFEIFVASRLKPGADNRKGSPSMNVATAGIVLAVVVMLLSISIVMGFKQEITTKIFSLDSHIKVGNAVLGLDENYSSVNGDEIKQSLNSDSAIAGSISSMSLIIEKPAILKTDDSFKGIIFRGVDKGYDWAFLNRHLVAGRVPDLSDDANLNEVAISSTVANELRLGVGDKIFTYFIDQKVKLRNSLIVGVFNTDFETHDKSFIIGNIAQLQGINGWDESTGNYVGINVNNLNNISTLSSSIFSVLAQSTYSDDDATTLHQVNSTINENMQYFTWLQMLDTNVVIILVLMMIVTGFTLIATLLMLVLERIRMIGLLKALGATNANIRNIFIYLTGRLVLRSLLLGDVIGLSLALLQKYFHILRLDPDSYYMPFVPVSLDPMPMILLNIAIIAVSYITLIAPSYIISSIRPTTTLRFD